MKGFFIAVLAPSLAVSQCMQIPVGLSERVSESTLIIEGQVLSQSTHWDDRYQFINTHNTIEVFKIFKGDTSQALVELITMGGTLEDEAMRVHPALQLRVGDVGVFTCVPKEKAFGPYASSQGFIRYDYNLAKAVDLFFEYDDVAKDLYDVIVAQVGQPFKEVKPFEFDPLGGGVRMPPSITNISPLTVVAGTSMPITITGTGFGASAGTVWFRNANTGGLSFVGSSATCDITSWTDTQIDLTVLSGAGSGTIFVEDAVNNSSPLSAQTLTIGYNISNIANCPQRTYLVDDDADADGGYEFCYSTSTANGGVDFTASSLVTDAMERAVDTWNSANSTGTLFPFFAGSGCCTTTNQVPSGSDNVNLISFDNGAYTLPAGVLGQLTSFYVACGASNWEVVDMDLIMRRDGTGGVTWEYGPALPSPLEYDFETVALHEIGHAHQMGHVINTSDVLHYALSNGTNRRTLNSDNIDGGNSVMSSSTAYSPPIIACCCGYNFNASRQAAYYDASNDCSVLLPIDDIYLTATRLNDNAAELTWHSDIPSVESYEVQRMDATGTFSAIYQVPAVQQYEPMTLVDSEVGSGESYYRVLFQAYDGASGFSNIAHLEGVGTASVQVHPNPAAHRLEVNLNKPVSQLHIIDALGATQVRQYAGKLEEVYLDVSQLPSGTYRVLAIAVDGSITSAPFVVY